MRERYRIPAPQSPFLRPGGAPQTEWWNYLNDLAGWIESIEAGTGTPMPTPEGDWLPASTILQGAQSIYSVGTLADGRVTLTLQGDQGSPDPSSYYGTDAAGKRGYRALADGLGDCTTDDLPEGATNLYYSDALADARVAAGIAAFKAAPSLGTLVNAANDAAAAAGGVPVGGLYRNASALMIRVV